MPISRSEKLLLVALVIVALALRLWWPGNVEFKYDEATTLSRATHLAWQGQLPAGIMSSVQGLPHPTLNIFVLAVPYFLTRAPEAGVIWQGLLGAVTIFLTYVLGQRYFSRGAGLAAAAMMTAAPWVIFFERKLWTQSLSIFTLLFAFGLFELITRRNMRGLPVMIVGIMASAAMYIGGSVYGITAVVISAVYAGSIRVAYSQAGRRQRWVLASISTAVVIGFGAAFFGGVVDSVLNGTLAAGVQPAAQDTGMAGGLWSHFKAAAQVSTGFQLHALAGDNWRVYRDTLSLPILNQLIDGGILLLVLGGLVYSTARAVSGRALGQEGASSGRRDAARPYGVLALWIASPVILFAAAGFEPQLHRYAQLLPAQLVASAVLLTDGYLYAARHVSSRGKLLLRTGMVVLLAGTAVWQAYEYAAVLRFQFREHSNTSSGIVAESIWASATEARELARRDDLPVVILARGDSVEYDTSAVQFDAVLGDLSPVIVDGRIHDVIPDGDHVVISAVEPDQRPVVDIRGGYEGMTTAQRVRFVNGVDFVDAFVSQSGSAEAPEGVSVVINWQIWGIPPVDEDYTLSANVLASDGQKLGQLDVGFVRTKYWREMDTVVTSVFIPVEAYSEITHLLVSLYHLTSDNVIQPVGVLDTAGNPAGNQVIVTVEP